MTHKLYAAPLSLYSGKARAYLDWKGIDYEEILSSDPVYKDIIIPKVGRPVIPKLRSLVLQSILTRRNKGLPRCYWKHMVMNGW
jgi:hypothetical protein